MINEAVKRQVDKVKTEIETLKSKPVEEDEENAGDSACHTKANIIDIIVFIWGKRIIG